MGTSDNNMHEAERTGVIDFTRGRDWFDPSKSNAHVTLVGCGGIGSVTALALAKMGIPRMTLIDGDTVETHNLPNQMFYLGDKGHAKVDALAEMCGDIAVTEIQTHHGFLNTESEIKPHGIVVSGLDSMAAREEVWKTIRYNPRVTFYIDARLGGESVVVYALDPRRPEQVRGYETTLYSDEDAVEAPCTRRSIIDVGFVVGSLITRTVRRHLAGDHVDPILFWNHESLTATQGVFYEGE